MPDEPRVHDPDSPATQAQRNWLAAHGVDPNAVSDPRLTKGRASDWITGVKANGASFVTGIPDEETPSQAHTAPKPDAPKDAAGPTPAGPATPTGGFVPASRLPPSVFPVLAPTGEEDDDRAPLTPVVAMTPDDRKKYGIVESETAVVQGTRWSIVPELGMPAKFVFARLSMNRRTGLPEARLFPSIEGLVFRANAYHKGIRKYSYEFIDQAQIPGLAAFLDETHDPELICRVNVTLGDGTEVVEHGTVRLSEVKLYQSRRTGRMVARSPVARSNPTELAVKRALARALRWGTGFGGTALDELPVPESEEAREKAGLKGGGAALPSKTGPD